MEGDFSLSYDFCNGGTVQPPLEWQNPPISATIKGDQGLHVIPKPACDYWCKAHRDPPAHRLTGHALLYSVPPQTKTCVAESSFDLKDVHRYDQAGLMIYTGDKNWIKTGLEMENGVPNMSCVATNICSDWNYVPWPSRSARIRATVTQFREVFECEVDYFVPESGEWRLLRSTFIGRPEEGVSVVKVGLFCSAPQKETEAEGAEVFFKTLSIQGKA